MYTIIIENMYIKKKIFMGIWQFYTHTRRVQFERVKLNREIIRNNY